MEGRPMTAVARRSGKCSEVSLEPKPLAEPELVYNPRPMVGFFAGLTIVQQSQALAYRGDEDHGDPEFLRSDLSAA